MTDYHRAFSRAPWALLPLGKILVAAIPMSWPASGAAIGSGQPWSAGITAMRRCTIRRQSIAVMGVLASKAANGSRLRTSWRGAASAKPLSIGTAQPVRR